MFAEWENFYIIVAPSAAALIGLMFVVETLTAENEQRGMEMGAKIFITPIVFHFSVVLVIGAMAEVPHLPPAVAAAILTVAGVWGVAYSALTTMRLFDLKRLEFYTPDLSDQCCYGIFPTLMYAGLAAVAGVVLVDVRIGEYALAVITMVILLIGIRNAWDLVTAIVKTLAKKRAEAKAQDPAK